MAKDRLTPCLHYTYKGGACNKGRTCEHAGYCQRCDKYRPRAKVRHEDMRRKKRDRAIAKEAF